MIHPAGVEVYLRPKDDNGSARRFHEFPVSPKVANHTKTQCAVLKTDGAFEFIIKFSDTFEMYSASALSIAIAINGVGQRSGSRFIWAQRSDVDTGRLQCNHFKNAHANKHLPFSLSGWPESLLNSKSNYKVSATKGTITLFMRRGNYKWLDGEDGPYGSKGPKVTRERVDGSFEALDGDEGCPLAFEFWPENQEQFKARGILGVPSQLFSNPQRFSWFSWDKDYESDVKAAETKLELMHAKWWREQNSTENDSTPPKLMMRFKYKKVVAPRVEAVLRKPSLCDCPIELHSKVPGSTIAGNIQRQPITESRRTTRPTLNQDSTAQSVSKKAAEPASQDSETVAVACVKCKKLKRAPRGKKISYRSGRGKWMYVSVDAPEEKVIPIAANEPALEKPTSVRDINNDDEDDEEQLPIIEDQPIPLPIEDAGSASADSADVPLHQAVVDNGMAGPRASHETQPNQLSEPSRQDPDHSVGVEDAGDVAEVPCTEGEFLSESSQTVTTVQPDSTVAHQEASANKDASLKQPETNKRPSEPLPSEHSPKQQRIDVDLTADDADELMMIKTESGETAKMQNASFLRDEDDENDLEDKLEDIKRQRKALQLEQEQADVQRKLRMLRSKRGTKSAVKAESVIIKIED